MFQKFEQTMVNLIFVLMDLSYGTKLIRDLRFQLLIHSKVNYQCILLICISFTTNCYILAFLLFSCSSCLLFLLYTCLRIICSVVYFLN